MAPEELRDMVQKQPFEPFRLVMTDGIGYEIRHPDLLLVGKRSTTVGLTGDPGETFYERTVKVDLLDVIRLEPLTTTTTNGQGGPK